MLQQPVRLPGQQNMPVGQQVWPPAQTPPAAQQRAKTPASSFCGRQTSPSQQSPSAPQANASSVQGPQAPVLWQVWSGRQHAVAAAARPPCGDWGPHGLAQQTSLPSGKVRHSFGGSQHSPPQTSCGGQHFPWRQV